jgi:antitoxin MazE
MPVDEVTTVLYHCYNVRTVIHRIGNSRGIIIPKPLLAQLELAEEVEMTVEHDAIVLRKPRSAVRAGWAEDSKALAVTGDDALVWPEFGNADDRDLTW